MDAVQHERVTLILDGDSFMTENRRRAVRLADVEAPERGQPGAAAATVIMHKLISGKVVGIETLDYDDYGRAIARVTLDGHSVNDAMRAMLAPEPA